MYNRKAKFGILDLIIIAVIAALGVYVAYRLRIGLNYQWNWRSIPRYLLRWDAENGRLVVNYLLEGLITTLKLSIWSTLLAIILGTALGLCRTSKNLFLQLLGRTYVELVRNLPPLVLVFIFYFFVSDQIMPILGVDGFIRGRSPQAQAVLAFLFARPSLFTQFVSGVVTIAVFEGAYITEIVRSGIDSIERGQKEAAYALGLSWVDQMRFVILPQAIKRILPQLGNQFISTIKDSAIVSAISIQELTFQGRQLATSTHYSFEVWSTVAVMYLVLTLTLSMVVGRWEKSLKKSD
ncbi:MAG: amino acid ABC transporter permease [Spirochaetales bacterium]|nr:amino acid ABC transporter permease [Spirochaetales bacterium]